MLEATLVAMGWAVSNCLIAGVRPTPMGNENITAAPSGTFRTGRRPAQHRRQQAGAVRGAVPAGRPRGADRATRASPTARTASATATSSRRELEQALAAKISAAEWAAELNAAWRAGRRGPVRAGGARASAGHRARADQALRRAPGVEREVAVVRAGFRLAHGDPAPASPPPALGADTDRSSASSATTADEIAALRTGAGDMTTS